MLLLFLDISRTAEKIGFKTAGRTITFADLATKTLLPCIAH